SPSAHPLRLHSFPTRRSSDLNATITGCLSPVVTVTANKNSFHIFVNCQMATTTKPVIESGIIMCLNTPRKLAPSILADSIMESRSEEHTSELQSRFDIVCRLL